MVVINQNGANRLMETVIYVICTDEKEMETKYRKILPFRPGNWIPLNKTVSEKTIKIIYFNWEVIFEANKPEPSAECDWSLFISVMIVVLYRIR